MEGMSRGLQWSETYSMEQDSEAVCVPWIQALLKDEVLFWHQGDQRISWTTSLRRRLILTMWGLVILVDLARLTSSRHEWRPDLHSHKDIWCYSVNVMDREREQVHYTVVGSLVIPKVFTEGVWKIQGTFGYPQMLWGLLPHSLWGTQTSIKTPQWSMCISCCIYHVLSNVVRCDGECSSHVAGVLSWHSQCVDVYWEHSPNLSLYLYCEWAFDILIPRINIF